MAATRSFLYFGGTSRVNPANGESSPFDFDESDIWNSNEVVESDDIHQSKKPLSQKSWLLKKPMRNQNDKTTVPTTSLPVKIPDWSRILGDEYKQILHRKESEDDGEDGDVEGGRLHPHDYLARRKGSSFSVHEGIGRTLKGRDTRRVRNAVWQQTGFED